jgi:hypothetical protein
MSNLKKLGAVLVLTLALGVSAFADDCIPGQIQTPCDPVHMAAPGDMDTTGQMETPSSDSQESFTEIAADVLKSILPVL